MNDKKENKFSIGDGWHIIKIDLRGPKPVVTIERKIILTIEGNESTSGLPPSVNKKALVAAVQAELQKMNDDLEAVIARGDTLCEQTKDATSKLEELMGIKPTVH